MKIRKADRNDIKNWPKLRRLVFRRRRPRRKRISGSGYMYSAIIFFCWRKMDG